jgi:SAM-dependent methyltransferase
MTRHLDLGCGDNPRNPFLADTLYGVDLVDFSGSSERDGTHLITADLFKPLPFVSSFFDSVSAYDFLEHVPRVAGNVVAGASELPFISLMNEIWRLLRHDGLFIASTPAFPHKKAFQDPTHVNIITRDTHTYFIGDEPYSRRYGFTGKFREVYVGWDAEKNAWNPLQSQFRKAFRNFEHAALKGGRSHITWIFKAEKPLS